ncbi:hypothetical protein [Hymenobacter yonginensis]|uniref:Uncharacterized protein n=1 Tax=Hymenobacter yonginensis TaxID=748197 RepID=A0ABY7PP62_9BACT|nr:hypothetical protein [Hymenobacter yonginensis]WBO85018.1 hypothetical protein O9Z63_01960 [Hymenobacter yonginensis]
MKYRLLPALLLPAAFATAQPTPRPPQTIALPPELADKNNQFSGLYLHGRELLLLSESRLQDQAEAKVYGLSLASLNRQLSGQPRELPYCKYPIRGLDQLRARIDSLGQVYEGLESLTVLNGVLYFTVETATAAPYCYLIKGRFDAAHTAIQLDPEYLVALARPALPDGTHVYNAGFEAMARYRRQLLLLFEYNAFPAGSQALQLSAAATTAAQLRAVPVVALPFRVTDMVRTGRGRYTAINYFFNGPDDTVYRPATTDANTRLVLDSAGRYQNYCRLIRLRYRRRQLRWEPLLELPRPYMTYNWEGLAAYRGGYFLLNDKYGPSGQSTLLYIKPE